MESLRFKTNINCSSCVKAVTGFINEVKGVENWTVDTQNPDKILSVQGEDLQIENILEAVKEAGFEIVKLEKC